MSGLWLSEAHATPWSLTWPVAWFPEGSPRKPGEQGAGTESTLRKQKAGHCPHLYGSGGAGVTVQGKGTPSPAQVASPWRKHHVLPLSPHLTVHNYSPSPHRQPWRRPSIANAIQQIHFINFNYIPTENEWSENIKHLPSRSFTFFIQ